MKTFHAISLEQIAESFDRLAEQAQMYADQYADKKQKRALYLRECSTWRRAAMMIRDTELHQAPAA